MTEHTLRADIAEVRRQVSSVSRQELPGARFLTAHS